jgi:hypothetical protein
MRLCHAALCLQARYVIGFDWNRVSYMVGIGKRGYDHTYHHGAACPKWPAPCPADMAGSAHKDYNVIVGGLLGLPKVCFALPRQAQLLLLLVSYRLVSLSTVSCHPLLSSTTSPKTSVVYALECLQLVSSVDRWRPTDISFLSYPQSVGKQISHGHL